MKNGDIDGVVVLTFFFRRKGLRSLMYGVSSPTYVIPWNPMSAHGYFECCGQMNGNAAGSSPLYSQIDQLALTLA